MLNKHFGSIRARMSGIYLLITVCALFFIGKMVSDLMEDFLVSQRTQNQRQETARLALEIGPELGENDAEGLYAYVQERAYSMGGRVLVLDTDAVVQADSASQHNGFRLPYREVRDVLLGGLETSFGFHHVYRDEEKTGLLTIGEEAVWTVYYTAPITVDGVYVGAVLYCVSIQDVVDSINDVTRQIAMIFIIMMITIVILVFLLSGWLTKPIVDLTAAIRRMGTQGYGVRVKVSGSGEIAELGNAFNRMSERIENHNRVRDEFIANASHELKTPLATMKLLSETILYQENPDPAMMKEFFGDVNHEMDRLSRIVTELLRLVQEDAGAQELVREPIRLDTLADQICKRLTPLAADKNIALKADVNPVTVYADMARMEQVVINLVENAVKYTDTGSVRVRVYAGDNEAVFQVSDTGIGIPEEAVVHLFERFYRVDKARSRGTGGTGLGLAIAEKIVALHGGYIQVSSKVGEGSTFTVHLPFNTEANYGA
ncbi:MAG: HAMP domain-containing sensor histidine kinase [Candidatus Pelethousia sp.]|nr:HAMP domain-containing sensor histidine kinase [Candidatus Pelethousia sp.]